MKGITRNIYVALEAKTFLSLYDHNSLDGIDIVAIHISSDAVIIKELYILLSILSAKCRFRFFFIYTNSKQPDQRFQETGRFFFLANYYFRKNGHPLLVLSKENRLQLGEEAKDWCSNQGFAEPEIAIINDFVANDTKDENNDYIQIIPAHYDQFFSVLLDNLQKLKWLNKSMIIYADNDTDVLAFKENLYSLHNTLKKGNPYVHQALEMIAGLQEDQLQKEAVIEYLQLEVSNLKTFVKLLHESKEVEHILNFYHTQYEVLPLWYKRFGHVIKILMGKRKISFPFSKKNKSNT